MIKKGLDYLAYITYSFICGFSKYNPRHQILRTINGVTIIIFLIVSFILTSLYMLMIKIEAVSFNKVVYFIACVASLILIRYWIKDRYKKKIHQVIKELGIKFNYSKKKVVVFFLSIWLASVLLVWAGLLILKEVLY